MRIRVRLYTNDRPKAEQSVTPIIMEIPDNTREFECAGKRYKIVWQQNSVHEGDKSGAFETDAMEC